MKYQSAAAFDQALKQRLKDWAEGDSARIVRQRKRIAFDRLLARLVKVAPRQWVLKGGFAMDLRLAARARTTKDIDIEWRAEPGELVDTLLDAASHDAGDFFEFGIERTGMPEERLGGSQRYRVSASLSAHPFETFPLDVGFRQDVEAESEALRTDDLLAFAGIDPVEIDAVPLEIQTAEKVHAYARIYQGGRASTRTKDLVDLVLIAGLAAFDARSLRGAIDKVFATRGDHSVPRSLPAPPTAWAKPFRRLADEVGIPNDLASGHTDAAALLDPVLSDEAMQGSWDSKQRRWAGEGSH